MKTALAIPGQSSKDPIMGAAESVILKFRARPLHSNYLVGQLLS